MGLLANTDRPLRNWSIEERPEGLLAMEGKTMVGQSETVRVTTKFERLQAWRRKIESLREAGDCVGELRKRVEEMRRASGEFANMPPAVRSRAMLETNRQAQRKEIELAIQNLQMVASTLAFSGTGTGSGNSPDDWNQLCRARLQILCPDHDLLTSEGWQAAIEAWRTWFDAGGDPPIDF